MNDKRSNVLSGSWKVIRVASDISNTAASGVIFEIQNISAYDESIEIISDKFLTVLDDQFKKNPLWANKENENVDSRLFVHPIGESVILKFGPLGHSLFEQSEYRVQLTREETVTTSGVHNLNFKIYVSHTMLVGADDQNVNNIASPKYYDAYEPCIKKIINNSINQTPSMVNSHKIIKHPF